MLCIHFFPYLKKSTLELEIYHPDWGFQQPVVPVKWDTELIRTGDPTPVAGTGDCCSHFPLGLIRAKQHKPASLRLLGIYKDAQRLNSRCSNTRSWDQVTHGKWLWVISRVRWISVPAAAPNTDTSDRIFSCPNGSCEHFFNSSPGQPQAFKDCLPSVNANPCVSYRSGKVPGRTVKLSLFKCLNELTAHG